MPPVHINISVTPSGNRENFSPKISGDRMELNKMVALEVEARSNMPPIFNATIIQKIMNS